MHHPSGLIGPSTRLQVFEAAMKFVQVPHFCAPLGWFWYFTPDLANFLAPVAVAASALLAEELSIVIGTNRQQPVISIVRNTSRRDSNSSCPVQVVAGWVSGIFLLM
jgi:hypothetical protein